MRKITTLVFLLLLLSPTYSQETEPRTYTMYGEGQTYIITLQAGWQMMMEFAQTTLGIDNFFIPEGFTPQDAPAGIMAYTDYQFDTLDEFIRNDLESFISQNPSYKSHPLSLQSEHVKADSIQCLVLQSDISPIQQYIAYFGADFTDFHFALAFQVFGETEKFYKDFLYATQNSYISPFNLKPQ